MREYESPEYFGSWLQITVAHKMYFQRSLTVLQVGVQEKTLSFSIVKVVAYVIIHSSRHIPVSNVTYMHKTLDHMCFRLQIDTFAFKSDAQTLKSKINMLNSVLEKISLIV